MRGCLQTLRQVLESNADHPINRIADLMSWNRAARHT